MTRRQQQNYIIIPTCRTTLLLVNHLVRWPGAG